MSEVGAALGAIGPGTRLWTGQVTSLAPLLVDGKPVAAAGGYPPLLGDLVLCASYDTTSWLLHYLPAGAQPAQVTVTATSVSGSPGSIAATDGTQSYVIPAVGTYVVGDVVMVDWQTSKGRVYQKVASQAGAPTTAPTSSTAGSASRQFRAIEAGSWQYGRWSGDRVRQFRYGSEDVNAGAWCYGGEPRQAVGSGTILSARIYLPRVRGGVGYSSGSTAHLYAHSSDRLPAGDVARTSGPVDLSVPRGSSWYQIPAELAQAALAGGISIAGGPEYVVCAGLQQDSDDGTPVDGAMSGALDLTWTTS